MKWKNESAVWPYQRLGVEKGKLWCM